MSRMTKIVTLTVTRWLKILTPKTEMKKAMVVPEMALKLLRMIRIKAQIVRTVIIQEKLPVTAQS